MLTVFNISLIRLWNNKQELLLAFLVPVVFFSIFAWIFSHGVGNDAKSIELFIVDNDNSELTSEVTKLIASSESIQSVEATSRHQQAEDIRALLAEKSQRVLLELSSGVQQSLLEGSPISISFYTSGNDPIALQMAKAEVTAAVYQAFMGRNASSPVKRLPPIDQPTRSPGDAQVRPAPPAAAPPPLPEIVFTEQAVFGNDKANPKVAMYAAGIAVMFLLFSASGAGGSLLEEWEAGTLERLLSSPLTLLELLAGKWLFITLLGATQLCVMFLWAQFAFSVDLLGHIDGFLAMTIGTAAASASLAILLAAVCRSRAQLHGVSIVLILTMSALGGSMIPRFVMSDSIKSLGRYTFNGWALDGFEKVFWHDAPIAHITPELSVLLVMAVALAALAWIFAGRWEPQ